MEQEAPLPLHSDSADSVSLLIVHYQLKVFIMRHLRTNDPAGAEEFHFDWKTPDLTAAWRLLEWSNLMGHPNQQLFKKLIISFAVHVFVVHFHQSRGTRTFAHGPLNMTWNACVIFESFLFSSPQLVQHSATASTLRPPPWQWQPVEATGCMATRGTLWASV